MPDPNTDPNAEVKDEIKQRQEDLGSLWTDRRSKLSPEDLKKEDDAIKADMEKKAKDKADADKASAIPEKYEAFKIPEGMEMDNGLLAEVEPTFKEIGLTQDKAQKVIDLYVNKVLPAYMKRQTDAWEAQKTAWVEAVKADKEIGGDKFQKSVDDANRVLNTIGTSELKKVFNDYGLGNHPEFVRVFARLAPLLAEDGSLVLGDKILQKKAQTIDDLGSKFYGGNNQ